MRPWLGHWWSPGIPPRYPAPQPAPKFAVAHSVDAPLLDWSSRGQRPLITGRHLHALSPVRRDQEVAPSIDIDG